MPRIDPTANQALGRIMREERIKLQFARQTTRPAQEDALRLLQAIERLPNDRDTQTF